MGGENPDEDHSKWKAPKKERLKETQETILTPEQAETADYWLKIIEKEKPTFSPEKQRECAPEIEKLENLFIAFEKEHSLEQLLLITDLTPKDAPNHPVREPAKNALKPITALLDVLKRETNITSEKYDELEAKYKILSRAVGMINNNKVDHTR